MCVTLLVTGLHGANQKGLYTDRQFTRQNINFILLELCYSCTMAARGLRGVREWRRYIDHEGGARVGL